MKELESFKNCITKIYKDKKSLPINPYLVLENDIWDIEYGTLSTAPIMVSIPDVYNYFSNFNIIKIDKEVLDNFKYIFEIKNY